LTQATIHWKPQNISKEYKNQTTTKQPKNQKHNKNQKTKKDNGKQDIVFPKTSIYLCVKIFFLLFISKG